jgi:tetratricopeptide (TPR) repeat protein
MPARSRRRSRVRVIAIALALGSVSLGVSLTYAPNDASGQKPDPRPKAKPSGSDRPDAGDRYDPENITAISQFMETVGTGNEKYAAKDYPGAIDVYKKAIQLNPRQPLGPYLLGEAYLAMNNLGEAEAAFKTAEDLNDPKQQLVRSHVLFALADCYEREKKWELARTAWQAYTEHTAKLGPDGGGHPLSGAARIKAVDDWLKLDKQYEIVRQRIAAERADSGAPDGGKPAAPKPAPPPAKK